MGRFGQRSMVAMACAAAVSLMAAPGARAPIAAGVPVPLEPPAMRAPTPWNPGSILPWHGRMELRPLLSRRLKLVLDYRPIAYC